MYILLFPPLYIAHDPTVKRFVLGDKKVIMLDECPGLIPVHFFVLAVECRRVPSDEWESHAPLTELPEASALCAEEPFAKVSVGWNENGLFVHMHAKTPHKHVAYPNITAGDSLELFVDTRDVKTSGFNTRFCHHFFFLPDGVEGVQAGEVTRFRTDDRHELCDPSLIKVKSQPGKGGYSLWGFLPRECFFGYDPEQFNRIGFTYRVNRHGGAAQHWAASSEEFSIEQQPALWGTLRLKK